MRWFNLTHPAMSTLEDQPRLLMVWLDGIYKGKFKSRPVLEKLASGGLVVYKKTETHEATKYSEAHESYVTKTLLPSDEGLVARLQTTLSHSDEVFRHSDDHYTFIPSQPQEGHQHEGIAGGDIREIVQKAADMAHEQDSVVASIKRIQDIEMKMGITAQLSHETGRAEDLPYATGLRGLDRQLAASRWAASHVAIAEEMLCCLESTDGITFRSSGTFGEIKESELKNATLQVQAKTFMTLSGGSLQTRLAIWAVSGAPVDAEAKALASSFMASPSSKHPGKSD